MPRDGSGTYTYPPGTPGIPDTTIESAKYNGYIADVQQDLNLPRPIVAGGTGATNATQARTNLQAEVATHRVTNYDSHVWQAGSFYSESDATAGPVAGHAFVGTCVLHGSNPTNYITLEAVDEFDSEVPNRRYVRQKRAGTWGPWQQSGRTAVGNVEGISGVAGDMFFGVLGTQPNSFFIVNSEADTGGTNVLTVSRSGPVACSGTLSVGATEQGGKIQFQNGGTNVWIAGTRRAIYADGTDHWVIHNQNIGTPSIQMDVNTNTVSLSSTVESTSIGTGALICAGGASFSKQLRVGGAINMGGTVTTGAIAATGAITATGQITTNAAVQVNSGAAGQMYFGSSPGIVADAANIYIRSIGNGPVTAQNSNASITYALLGNGASRIYGTLDANTYLCRAGNGGALSGQSFIFDWTGTQLQAFVGITSVGFVTLTSDYRIKKDVIDLPGMWDTVKALRPIKYTQAEFTAPVQKAADLKERKAAETEGAEPKTYPPTFVADDIERWGFIAHELQDTLIPNAATGVKDDPVVVQSPNPFTLIAALTKALQEAMARIEVLEAAQATP